MFARDKSLSGGIRPRTNGLGCAFEGWDISRSEGFQFVGIANQSVNLSRSRSQVTSMMNSECQ